MTEAEALRRMKAPSSKRPGVWRNGVMQIWITRACDLACTGCTQGSQLAGKPGYMSVSQFEVAMQSLEGYWGVVGVFGGNPCVSPYFQEICSVLEEHFPKEQRGLWSNNLKGHGEICRRVFNSEVSNLNVHKEQAAYDEIRRDWPEAHPKGLHEDSRHSPPYVALQDMEDVTKEEAWGLISECDVNQNWSAMIGVVHGQPRGFFCELAGAQAMLHPEDPHLGCQVVPGWWKNNMQFFSPQVRKYCMACGIPMRGRGDFAVTGRVEQVSKTHLPMFRLKRPGTREIQVITKRSQLEVIPRATAYLPTEPGGKR